MSVAIGLPPSQPHTPLVLLVSFGLQDTGFGRLRQVTEFPPCVLTIVLSFDQCCPSAFPSLTSSCAPNALQYSLLVAEGPHGLASSEP